MPSSLRPERSCSCAPERDPHAGGDGDAIEPALEARQAEVGDQGNPLAHGRLALPANPCRRSVNGVGVCTGMRSARVHEREGCVQLCALCTLPVPMCRYRLT